MPTHARLPRRGVGSEKCEEEVFMGRIIGDDAVRHMSPVNQACRRPR